MEIAFSPNVSATEPPRKKIFLNRNIRSRPQGRRPPNMRPPPTIRSRPPERPKSRIHTKASFTEYKPPSFRKNTSVPMNVPRPKLHIRLPQKQSAIGRSAKKIFPKPMLTDKSPAEQTLRLCLGCDWFNKYSTWCSHVVF